MKESPKKVEPKRDDSEKRERLHKKSANQPLMVKFQALLLPFSPLPTLLFLPSRELISDSLGKYFNCIEHRRIM